VTDVSGSSAGTSSGPSHTSPRALQNAPPMTCPRAGAWTAAVAQPRVQVRASRPSRRPALLMIKEPVRSRRSWPTSSAMASLTHSDGPSLVLLPRCKVAGTSSCIRVPSGSFLLSVLESSRQHRQTVYERAKALAEGAANSNRSFTESEEADWQKLRRTRRPRRTHRDPNPPRAARR
jgi:hypothetical protein